MTRTLQLGHLKPLDLSGLLIEIQTHCKRLGITIAQALERFGRVGKNLSMLSDIDLATLRTEMVGWQPCP